MLLVQRPITSSVITRGAVARVAGDDSAGRRLITRL